MSGQENPSPNKNWPEHLKAQYDPGYVPKTKMPAMTMPRCQSPQMQMPMATAFFPGQPQTQNFSPYSTDLVRAQNVQHQAQQLLENQQAQIAQGQGQRMAAMQQNTVQIQRFLAQQAQCSPFGSYQEMPPPEQISQQLKDQCHRLTAIQNITQLPCDVDKPAPDSPPTEAEHDHHEECRKLAAAQNTHCDPVPCDAPPPDESCVPHGGLDDDEDEREDCQDSKQKVQCTELRTQGTSSEPKDTCDKGTVQCTELRTQGTSSEPKDTCDKGTEPSNVDSSSARKILEDIKRILPNNERQDDAKKAVQEIKVLLGGFIKTTSPVTSIATPLTSIASPATSIVEWPRQLQVLFVREHSNKSQTVTTNPENCMFHIEFSGQHVTCYNVKAITGKQNSTPPLAIFETVPLRIVQISPLFRDFLFTLDQCNIRLGHSSMDSTDGKTDRALEPKHSIRVTPKAKGNIPKDNVGVALVCEEKEWALFHAEFIDSPEDLRLTPAQEKKTPEAMCIDVETKNLTRILGSLKPEVFISLVDTLQKTAIITAVDGNVLLTGKTQESQVKGLLGILETCSPSNLEKFAQILTWKKETFALGYQLAWMYKYCKKNGCKTSSNISANNSNMNEGLVLKLEHICPDEKQILEMINNNRQQFRANVLREMDQTKAHCILLELNPLTESELRHLRLDIDSGTFVRRYVEWIQSLAGGIVPDKAVIGVTLQDGKGEVLLEQKAHVCLPDEEENNSAASRVTGCNDDMLDDLTRFDKAMIRVQLIDRAEPPQAVLFRLQFVYFKRVFIFQCDKSDVRHLLLKLHINSVLGKEEMDVLVVHYERDEYRDFLCGLIATMSAKSLKQAVEFVCVLTSREVTLKLARFMKSVLDYCQEIRPEFWTDDVKSAEKKLLSKISQEEGQGESVDYSQLDKLKIEELPGEFADAVLEVIRVVEDEQKESSEKPNKHSGIPLMQSSLTQSEISTTEPRTQPIEASLSEKCVLPKNSPQNKTLPHQNRTEQNLVIAPLGKGECNSSASTARQCTTLSDSRDKPGQLTADKTMKDVKSGDHSTRKKKKVPTATLR